jgi:hypothetical protein
VLHRGAHLHELRKAKGTSKLTGSSAAFLFEVPGSNSPLVVQELQIGGTSASLPKFVIGFGTFPDHSEYHQHRLAESAAINAMQ